MEELLPVLVLIAWSILSAVGSLMRKKKGQQAGEEGAAPEPAADEAATRRRQTAEQLLRELGVDLQPAAPATPPPLPRPVAAQPVPPVPVQPIRVRRPVPPPPLPLGPAQLTASSEAVPDAFAVETPPPELETPIGLNVPPGLSTSSDLPASGLAGALLRDLYGGRDSLGRAVLLSEVLGPPVALRPPAEPR